MFFKFLNGFHFLLSHEKIFNFKTNQKNSELANRVFFSAFVSGIDIIPRTEKIL